MLSGSATTTVLRRGSWVDNCDGGSRREDCVWPAGWGGMQSSCGSAVSGGQQVILPFSSSGSLTIDIPASVHYQPGGKAEAVITGDPALLDHVRIEGGRLSMDCNPGWSNAKFDVSLSGPLVTDWRVRGSGDAEVAAAADADISISGSGNIELYGHPVLRRSEIRGSGRLVQVP